jgi:hypothetical protein
MLTGACLCAGVRFTLDAAPTAPTACHCAQCRKQTGHYLASANVPKASVRMHSADTLRWFPSSEKVRRGFCGACGSTLFWEPLRRDWTSVALGAIEGPTGLQLERHIFVAEKGDYYDIADGLPQSER